MVERDGVLLIDSIHVTYRLEVPAGKREEARRALDAHVEHCPVARTLIPCVDIEWEADVREA